jgi:hypothetical protein
LTTQPHYWPAPTAAEFVRLLEAELASHPILTDRHYASFDFTHRGPLGCHALTVKVLAAVCRRLPGVSRVDTEVHFNRADGVTFWPDVVGWDRSGQIAVAIDFESPNSSDARVPFKDVQRYLELLVSVEEEEQEALMECQRLGVEPDWSPLDPFPYFIVTSLPTFPVSAASWPKKWTSPGYWNEGQDYSSVRGSPFVHWYAYYRSEVASLCLQVGWHHQCPPISFVNLAGKHPSHVDVLPSLRWRPRGACRRANDRCLEA